MKKCIVLSLLLIMFAIMTGCGHQFAPQVIETEPTATYDWMAGESPVPNQRVGIFRSGVNVGSLYTSPSPTGVYTVSTPVMGGDRYIMYADYGSDTFVKLCGRADCTHDNSDCNAYLRMGYNISYYGGYLYAATGDGAADGECELLRMDPDGRNRITLLDVREFASKHGGDFARCDAITDGYCLFSTYYWNEIDEGSLSGSFLNAYIYKLDGSMKEPKLLESDGMFLYQCGDVSLVLGPDNCYYDWDMEKDQLTYLSDSVGATAWYGKEVAYYFKDGAVCRMTYENQMEEVLIKTDLKGEYLASFFPDCLILASREVEREDNNLYIYNWEFELVDTVELPNPNGLDPSHLVVAETAERLILSDIFAGNPKFYIEKSELGTGNCEVHEYHYS